MMNNIEELFPFYALDALSEEERQQVEEYLKENPSAEERLLPYFEAAALVPLENDPVTPSPKVKQALMARIEADLKPEPKPQPSTWSRLKQVLFARSAPAIFTPAIPVLLGMLVFLFFRNNGYVRQLDQTISDQQALIAEQQDAIAEQQVALQDQQALIDQQELRINSQLDEIDQQLAALSVYTAVHSEVYTIASTGVQSDSAFGKLTVNFDTGQATLDVESLQADADTVYQLWFILGDTPVSAGVFDVSESGSTHYLVATAVPANFDAIGVSIEPPGGSEQPTGDIVLLGTTSS